MTEYSMDYESLLNLLKTRRSVRKFKPDPVSDGDVRKILEAARWAPSGANSQPWEFIVVRDKSKVAEVIEAFAQEPRPPKPGDMKPPPPGEWKNVAGWEQVSVWIAVCGDTRTKRCFMISKEGLDKEKIHYAGLSTAIQNMHLAATTLGLGLAWITVREATGLEGRIKNVLGLPDFMEVFHFIPVGYPTKTPPPGYRRSLEDVTHWEHLEVSKQRTDEEIDDWSLNWRARTFVGEKK